MSGTAPCPPGAELQQFLLGELVEAERLEAHLAGCAACLDLAQTLAPRDLLLEAVRAGPGGGGHPALREVDDHLMRRLCALRSTPVPSRPEAVGEATQEGYDFLAPPGEADELGRFGPYGVLRVLGRGGMGVVFAARQARPRRLVALKMILAGPHASRERLSRFRSETDIVARLQHPNIVQVHEAGEYDGRPYFTMEHVDGGNLAQKLAVAPLAPRAAAEFTAALARAVHFAHEHGVVHRDLKPSNVLLDAGGIPKIADFGLAKQFAGEPAAPGERTESGAILGTPAYMAPELAAGSGGAAGPAVDVYSLGAILYECLTGRPPFRAATPLETLDQVRSQEPVPPGRLQPGLPRDLQTVCLKCLEKEPARRYASALDLADDLDRFRAGEPVQARPASLGLRLTKWARRKPALAALVLVSGLSLAALGAVSLVYQSWLRAAVHQAEAEKAAARRQQELATANYRAARAALRRMLDRLQGERLAEVPRLRELRQQQMEDALAFYQEVTRREDNPDPELRQDIAWASMQTGAIQLEQGQGEAAAANFRRAIALLEGLPEELRRGPQPQYRLAECCSHLGALAQGARQWEEMESDYQRALAYWERVAAENPHDPEVQNNLAAAEHLLGAGYLEAGRPAEALPHFQRSVDLRLRLVGEHPHNDFYRLQLAQDYGGLGLLYQQQNRLAEAGAVFAKADEFLGPLARKDPHNGDYQLALAALSITWGSLLRLEGQSRAALERESRAIDLARELLRREPRHAFARSVLCSAHGTRAQIYDALESWKESLQDWDVVLELDDGPDRQSHRTFWALTLARAGEHDRAVAEATTLLDGSGVGPYARYNLVRVFALAVEPTRSDVRLPPAVRAARAECYAAQALSVLRQLQKSGYFQGAGNRRDLQADPHLDSLRARADFRELLEDAQGNTGR